jgi:hypothetical protein
MCADERGNSFYLMLRARCPRSRCNGHTFPLLSRRSYPSLHGRGGCQTQPPDGVLMAQTMGSNRAPHHVGQRPAHHAGQSRAPRRVRMGCPALVAPARARCPRTQEKCEHFLFGQCNPKNYSRRSSLHHASTAHAQPAKTRRPHRRSGAVPPTAWTRHSIVMTPRRVL